MIEVDWLHLSALGVYLHFPWCRKLCPYCDFAVEVGAPPHDTYLAAIRRELAARTPAFAYDAPALESIYFGGGTPSLWRPDCLAAAVDAVREAFRGAAREVTIEANPTDVTDEHLAAWRAAGIGRISIGVQALDADTLVALGRDHRFGDGQPAVDRALAAGFTVSADFILGVPGASRPPVPPLATDHLSVYELTIEERTVFGRRAREGRLVPLDEDALEALYVQTHDRLVAAGFEHYEISSYARPGKRAVHNQLYWQGARFLGLGVGAASLELRPDGTGVRQTNPRRFAEYGAGPAEIVELSAEDLAVDRAWLGMRTTDGAALPPHLADEFVRAGLAERRGERISPTLRGFLLADRIAARIVQSWRPPHAS
ncbi:MAG TPA: coproporphyrinogen-III oxidase family protein [Kofleriaceae bacterium]|jgi:oxygen-independent coproporphyrinogen-3 oxidase